MADANSADERKEASPASPDIPRNPLWEKYDSALARSTALLYEGYKGVLGHHAARFQAFSFSLITDNPKYQAKVLMRQSPKWAAAVLTSGSIHPKHAANILKEMEKDFAGAVLEDIPVTRKQEIEAYLNS